MNRTISIAPVRKSLVVEASPQRAFEVFTAGIDAWWPKKHGIGATPITRSVIEPFVGGRWYTHHEDGKDVVIGHVRAWEPGARFVVGWEISSEWKPDARTSRNRCEPPPGGAVMWVIITPAESIRLFGRLHGGQLLPARLASSERRKAYANQPAKMCSSTNPRVRLL